MLNLSVKVSSSSRLCLARFTQSTVFQPRYISRSTQSKDAALATNRDTQESDCSDNQLPLKSFDDIPGPKGLPFLGTALDYIRKKDGIRFDKMFEVHTKRSEQYGNIYKETIAPYKTLVVISDYKEYLKVVRADGKMPVRHLLEPMMDWRKSKGIKGGLLANGEEWLKYRTGVNKKMLRPKEVAQYMVEMDESTKDMLKLVDHYKKESGVIDDIAPILFRWSLETINTYILEKRLGALDIEPNPEAMMVVHNVREFFRQSQDMVFSLPFYKLFSTKKWKDYGKINEDLFGLQNKIVDQRMKELTAIDDKPSEDEPKSLISYLLSSNGLSVTEATFILTDLIGAAVDTASNTTLWGLYLLSQHPDKQQALFNEISSVIGDKENITPELMNDLKYTKACVKESMRLYPVAIAVNRTLNKDVEVCGYLIPEGTEVIGNTYTMLRNPEVFPQPTEFIPERWLTKDNKEDMAVINLVWGHGARMCVGRRLAEQEMHLGLARLVQKYKISYAGDAPPEPTMRLVLSSNDPVAIKFTERV